MPSSIILTLIFVLGISVTGVFAFYDINSLEQRATREVNEFARNLRSQAQKEVDDDKTSERVEEKIIQEEYEKVLSEIEENGY